MVFCACPSSCWQHHREDGEGVRRELLLVSHNIFNLPVSTHMIPRRELGVNITPPCACGPQELQTDMWVLTCQLIVHYNSDAVTVTLPPYLHPPGLTWSSMGNCPNCADSCGNPDWPSIPHCTLKSSLLCSRALLRRSTHSQDCPLTPMLNPIQSAP